LKDNKYIIESISVGYKHTVCKTILGYAYIWGDNSFNQILGNEKYYSLPQKI
jgi:alpha-tubulin suppressor-like RCC1 family protein